MVKEPDGADQHPSKGSGIKSEVEASSSDVSTAPEIKPPSPAPAGPVADSGGCAPAKVDSHTPAVASGTDVAPPEPEKPSVPADGTPADATPSEPSTATPEAAPEAAPSSTPSDSVSPYSTDYAYHSESNEGGYYGADSSASSGSGTPPEPPKDETSSDSDEEEGGGPVKSFLEHLEDLRWVIVRCATVLFLAMMVCLLGVNYIVTILKWPLKRASLIQTDAHQFVSVMFGPKEVFSFRPETNHVGVFSWGTNKHVILEFTPVTVDSNQFLALQVRANSGKLPPEKELPLIYLDPAAPFISSLHLAFFGGMILAGPFVIYYLAQFIVPALKEKERKYFMRAMVPAVGLFMAGVCLCYFGIMPIALKAAEKYSLWMGIEMPQWRAETYFGFITKFMLGMGLGFEMPVILLALVKVGVLDYKKLAGFRRYMIVINLLLGALLTTPEVLTQLAMFIPLQILYEITIWIAWYWDRKEKKRIAAAEAAEASDVK